MDKKPTTVLMGRQIQAKYKDQKVKEYKHNPLIEALPDIFNMHYVAKALTSSPSFNQEDVNEPVEIRMHLIEQIKHGFIQPLPIHLELESKISLMIRSGYKGRNPVSPLYARQFAVGIKEILEGDYDDDNGNILGNRSTASSFAMIGISGIGKSTAIEKTLLLYPQVIIHSDYEHNGLSIGFLKQIVWLVIECPFNGSRGTLCKNFFSAVDGILGSNYYEQFVKQRMNESDLIDKMAHIATLHCIGVLVFDEIQRMKKGTEGQQTMNYFVEIHNKLGVPLVFIGTYKAIDLFTPLLANARRASGMGVTFADRMEKNKEWDHFLNRLWKFQWLKESIVLSDEINELIYYETQGITDLVVNLFMQAQYLALSTGKEKLSVNIIKRAANKNLKLLHPMLEALRIGDVDKLKNIDDLKPDWVEVNKFIERLPGEVRVTGAVTREHEKAISDAKDFVQYVTFAQNFGLAKKEAVEVVSKILAENEGTKDNVMVNKLIAENLLLMKSIDTKHVRKKRTLKNESYMHVIATKALEERKLIEEELCKLNVIAPFDEFISR